MTSDKLLNQPQKSDIVSGLFQLTETRFQIRAQLLAKIALHASSH